MRKLALLVVAMSAAIFVGINAAGPEAKKTLAAQPRPSAGGKVVLAAGDIQAQSSTSNPTEAVLDANPHDALLALGDLQYTAGTLAQFNTSFSQTWGDLGDKRRIYPIPGNHEHGSTLASNFCAYFRTGTNGPAAVDPCARSTTRPHYAATIGDWRVLAFDTGSSGSTNGDLNATQATFLRTDLAADTHKCELVFMHHPRYSAGSHGSNPALADNWQDMMNAGVDVVLAGHDHNYQRWNRMSAAGAVATTSGIREFVVGSGGRSHYSSSRRPTGLQAINTDSFGVLRLVLKAGGYDWRFLPEAGRSFTDAGTDTCR
jgi:hypothetical protein